MKPARIVTLLVAAVAVVLVVIVISGGSSNPTYVMTFETAGQLVNDNDVQVGGRRVGKDERSGPGMRSAVRFFIKSRKLPLGRHIHMFS